MRSGRCLTSHWHKGVDALERAQIQNRQARVPRAIERAAPLAGKDRTALAALKRGLYAETLALLEGADPPGPGSAPR